MSDVGGKEYDVDRSSESGEPPKPAGGISRFEDLRAWQAARELAKLTYARTRGPVFRQDPSLCRQLQRSAVSAMANVAEGHGRTGSGEFAHFLSVALGSLTEFRSHLYVALDTAMVSQEAFDELMAMAVRAGRIAGALRSAVDKRKRETPTVREPQTAYSATNAGEYPLCAGSATEFDDLPPTPNPLRRGGPEAGA